MHGDATLQDVRGWPAIAVTFALVACAPSNGVIASGARGTGTSVAPTTTTTATTATTTVPGGLRWGSCDRYADDFALTDMVGLSRADLECAALTVPLDHAEPGGATIDLAVGRAPARRPAARIGSLVLNPGGPGGSGLEFLPQFLSEVGDELRDRFDIVSFDPRGVGESTPIRCLTDRQREDSANADPTPDDEAELVAQLEARRTENSSCVVSHPDLVPRMGTMNVARDLDLLRGALGDDVLTYAGFSYGTRIGAVYAELFPDRVRALVLDGSVFPEGGLETLRDGQFTGFRTAFDRFVVACADDADCPLDDARESVLDLVALAASDPIDTLDDRPLTEGRAVTAIGASLYDAESWDLVWGAIDSALDGQATILGLLADLYAGRRPDGSWANSDESFDAVMCADHPERPTIEQLTPRAGEMIAQDPFWGPLFAYNPLLCEGAAPAIDPIPTVLTAPDAPPILVVGTRGDPATPYEWAVQMAESLVSGVLVTYEGDGHTAYGSSRCATAIVDEYLLTAVAPTGDQVCEE